MPGFDQTGPQGRGPATGRGFGNCVPRGISRNFGFGRGRGYRHIARATGLPRWQRDGFQNASLDPDANDRDALREQEKFFESRLNEIREQLKSYDNE